jgi:hypothetical protein
MESDPMSTAPHKPTVQELLPLVIEFLTLETETGLQQIVTRHPELLTDAADFLLSCVVTGQHFREIRDFISWARDTLLLMRVELTGLTTAPVRIDKGLAIIRSRISRRPRLVPGLQIELSKTFELIAKNHEELQEATDAYELALTITKHEDDLVAADQSVIRIIANAYFTWSIGRKVPPGSIKPHAYTDAMDVLRRHTDPAVWAETMIDLGDIHLPQQHGYRLENIAYAIAAYEEAVQLPTWPRETVGQSQTADNLGRYVFTPRAQKSERRRRAGNSSIRAGA